MIREIFKKEQYNLISLIDGNKKDSIDWEDYEMELVRLEFES